MLMNVNDERAFATPAVAQLQSELAALETDSFLILSRADEDYLQVYREDDGSFVVEHRDGSSDKHYYADTDDVDVPGLQSIFAAYFNGDPEWKAVYTWEKVDFDENFEGDEGLAELPTPQ